MTGEILDDRYFTQTLLPDYIAEHSEAATWNVVFDARGHFTEPHTKRSIGLGTLEVRDYLQSRPAALLRRHSVHRKGRL